MNKDAPWPAKGEESPTSGGSEHRSPFFEWRDDWTLDVGFMDEDHRMLAGLLARIARDFGGRAPPADRTGSAGQAACALLAALDELVHHTREHFRREEDVMHTLHYPDYVAHKSEHDMLLAEFSVMVREIRDADQARLDLSTLDALKTWLMGHVLDVDRDLAEYLKRAEDQNPEG